MDELQFSEHSTYREIHYASLLVDEIENENFDEVKWLLMHKNVNPNIVLPRQGISPMHVLAGFENESFSVEVLKVVLVEKGGDPNIRSADGLTPVHLAAIWGRCVVLDILLKYGGDPFLLDYKFSLNAEDLALKECQWKTHAILATFSVFNECEEQLHSYPCKQSSEQVEWPSDSIKVVMPDFENTISKVCHALDHGNSMSKNIQSKDVKSTVSIGGSNHLRKNTYQSLDSNSCEESFNLDENKPVDERSTTNQDKKKKKLSDKFSESFTKFKHYFGRTSVSKLSSDSSPKGDTEKRPSNVYN